METRYSSCRRDVWADAELIIHVDNAADSQPSIGYLQQAHGEAAKLVWGAAGPQQMLPRKKYSCVFAFREATVPGQCAEEPAVLIIHGHLAKAVGPIFTGKAQRHGSQEAA